MAIDISIARIKRQNDKMALLLLESFSCHREIIGWSLLNYLDRKRIRTRLPRKESFYKL